MDVFRGCCVLYERHRMQWGLTVVPLPGLAEPAACLQAHSAITRPAGQLCRSSSSSPDQTVAHGTSTQAPRQHLPTAPWTTLLEPDVMHMAPCVNADFEADKVHVTVSSPVQPPTRRTLDLITRQWTSTDETGAAAASKQLAALASRHARRPRLPWMRKLLQPSAKPAPAGRAGQWESHVHWVPSQQGPKVPVTLSHAAGLHRDGSHPALLLVYGAYGTSLEASWELQHLPLLARGWVIAHAHVRGGARPPHIRRSRCASCIAEMQRQQAHSTPVSCCRNREPH